MATTAKSGKTGVLTLATVAYEVTQFTINLEDELLDGTSFDSNGWGESVVGLRRGTGSLTAIGSLPASTAAASAAFVGQVTNATGDEKITGDVYLQTRAISVPVDGRVEFTADFTFTGAVTETTVA